jgi:hypothetical protein
VENADCHGIGSDLSCELPSMFILPRDLLTLLVSNSVSRSSLNE